MSDSPASLGVEGVAHGVAQKVEGDHQHGDAHHRGVEVERVGVEEVNSLVHRLPPRGDADHADAEVGEARLGRDEGRQGQ